jgi:CHAT domain-containing protein/Tfp pilus assembly protein PilF
MSYKLRAILILLLGPLLTFAQSVQPSIQTEVDLVSVLCSARENERSREELLRSHPQLVNNQLWSVLTSHAVSDFYGPSPGQSLATYEIALQVATQLHSPQLVAKTYYNIGRTYSGLNQLPKAVEAYEESRRLFEESGLQRDLSYVFADLGRLYFILEDYQKAKTYSEQSLSRADTGKEVSPGTVPIEFAKATALATLADLHLRDGDYDQAVQKLQTALALHEQLNRENSYYKTFIADDHQTLGRVFTASGDYTQALIHLNQALKIVKSLTDSDAMANLLNSIGVLYLEQEDYSQAKKSLDNSLQIYLSINKQKEAAKVLLNLGVIEQRQSNYEEALTRFKLSLQAAKTTQSIDVSIAAGEGIGVVLTAKKDFTGALEALNHSLAIAKDTEDKTRQTELLWRTAQTYYEMEDYAQATSLAEGAVTLAHATHLPKLTYLATTTLGQSHAAEKKVALAIQTLAQAVEQLEMMRDQVAGSEIESQLFLENKVTAYHSLVDLLIKQDKPLDALLFAERAKGRVLLDVLSGGKPDLAKFLTPAEKAEAQRLNRKISEINDRINSRESADSSSLDSMYRKLDAARLEYQSFQDALYVSHPDLRVRRGRTSALTSADVNQLTLNKDCAYLEYVVSRERVYLFVLTSTNGFELKAYSLPIKPTDLAQKVDQFHQRLADRHPDFARMSRELYATLIEPARSQLKGISTICIVPDGFLWNLPFQALMTPDNRYLIEDRTLYYSPSLSLLREMTKDRTDGTKRDALLIAFGNPVIGKDDQHADVCPLPEAEQEVSSIAKTIGATSSKVLIGRDATERTFKTLAPSYSIVHLATHGVIDNKHPLYSHLVLTRSDGDPENDGLLEAREIMNLNLSGDLAVLSACETANGRISPGEGVIGLSWAFFVAGTRSILVSQWKVNSHSTSQFVMAFYSNLKSEHGQTRLAESVRNAQLTLLKTSNYRHPFYWAPFVLFGRDRYTNQ